MLPRSIHAALLCVLLTWALIGCNQRETAENALSMNALAKEPAYLFALERLEFAQTLAEMNLSRDQALALKAWAQTDGQASREAVQESVHQLGGLAPNVARAADALVRERAVSAAEQKAVCERELGKNAGLLDGDAAAPIEIDNKPNFESQIDLHAKTLRPVVATLGDRVQLTLLGSWGQVRSAVATVVMAKDERKSALSSKRKAAVRAVMDARKLDPASNSEVAKRLTAILEKAPSGQKDGSNVDELVGRLLAAAPPADADAQVAEATLTLAMWLSLESAPELLDLVP
jgi:hypothetical protein